MSGRSVSSLTLAVGLLVGAVGVAAAQDAGPAGAPMPRAKAPGCRLGVPALGPIEIELDFQLPRPQPAVFFGPNGLYHPLPPARLPMARDMSCGIGSYCAPPLPKLAPPTDHVVILGPGTIRLAAAPGDTLTAPAPCPLPNAQAPRPGPATPAGATDRPATDGPSDHRQVFNFGGGLFGSQRDATPTTPAPCQPAGMNGGFGSGCTSTPLPPIAPASPPKLVIDGPGCIQLIGAEDIVLGPPTCPPCPLPKVTPNPLLGTWYRELPGAVIAATFGHDELTLSMTRVDDENARTTNTIALTAHYTVTKDGLVFGAVTGGDVTGEPGAVCAERAATLRQAVDMPFSFRAKLTSAGLMISGLRCAAPMADGEGDLFGGLFKCAKDGKVPTPAATAGKASRTGGRCDCGPDPRACPQPAFGAAVGGLAGAGTGAACGKAPPVAAQPPYIERVGIDFSTNLPTRTPPLPCPVPPAGAEPFGPPVLTKIPHLNQLYQNAGPLPQPGVSADATRQLAQDAFNQLLQQSGVVPPAGGMTLPTGRYLEHFPQYFPPDPAFPMPRELAQHEPAVRPARATVPAPVANAGPVGTWVREVAGKQCVLAVTPDHLTLTVHDAHEVDGKVSTASLVITADYHLGRDGATAVGLITSVDVSFEGEFPAEDSRPFFEMLADLQKVLEEKPFALTFRSYGESLVVGNVRMPQVSDRMEVQPAGYLGGRYKAVGDKLPKPKVTKMPTESRLPPGVYAPPPGAVPAPGGLVPGGVPPLPTAGGYPDAVPTLPPPPAYAPAPTGDLLPPQRVPSSPPRVLPSGGLEPAPRMPAPTAPGAVIPVALGRQNSDSDPNVRMQQLLFQSERSGPIGETPLRSGAEFAEDLRQLRDAWRQFWFNDRPSRLTPERIHGGIY